MRRPLATVAIAALAGLAMFGCDSGNDSQPAVSLDTTTTAPTATAPADSEPDAEPSSDSTDDRFPDIVGVEATYDDTADTWTFAVTVSSPYDTPERYADGWRVIGDDGTVYGTHTLTHDHASEQPFTRTQSGVEIPADVDEVTIEGRDIANGFGGATVSISLQTDER